VAVPCHGNTPPRTGKPKIKGLKDKL
jgi:hypothetical protein